MEILVYKVIVPRFYTYLMKKSIAHRASTVWDLLVPVLATTTNVKNFTIMATQSKNFQAFLSLIGHL